jgi:hypothetical protein
VATDNEFILHAGVGKSACKSCRKPITWAFTTAGNKAPFELDDDGEWILENGTARHVGPRPAQLELGGKPGPQRYTNHFATCPQASSWRGKK